jgi:hypothetical protein
MNKDFRLILETAAEMKVPMPATAAAFQINSAEFGGETEGDFSIVVELMETLGRVRLRETDSIDKSHARAASPDLRQNKPDLSEHSEQSRGKL